ncbi:MAG TPA: hypothetical protein VFT30_03005, partial [Nitrospira sp.]|nr:hypothetical protein [Nitrospira sp.]
LGSGRAQQVLAEIEMAQTQILFSDPTRVDENMAEVERRFEVFARRHRTSVRTLEHPRLSALQSVYSDIARGRL